MFKINGITIIRAGHRQAVDLIRGAIGVLRITATSVLTNIGKQFAFHKNTINNNFKNSLFFNNSFE